MIRSLSQAGAARLWTVALAVALGASLAGCGRDPEQACEAFMGAVHQQDTSLIFDSLLVSTQVSFQTVAKEQRQMRRLIESAYPKEEQAPALARLIGGDASSGRELFALLYPQRYEADIGRRMGQGARTVHLDPGGATATCARASGQPFRFARGPHDQWGMAELDAEWELAKLRALHGTDTVRENARLYTQTPNTTLNTTPNTTLNTTKAQPQRNPGASQR